MSSDYNGVSATYARFRDMQPAVVEALKVWGGAGPDSQVLEVGCGTANHLVGLCSAVGCRGVGVDLALEMLHQAVRAGSDKPLSVGRAEALPFASAVFDLLFSVDVVHHLRDLDAAFVEMARLLRPGGVLLTVTDSESTIRARVPLTTYFPETVELELARYPRVRQLEVLHTRSGLERVRGFVLAERYLLQDSGPFRERAYSCLHLISEAALCAGVAALERDLPLSCVSRSYVMVARKRG